MNIVLRILLGCMLCCWLTAQASPKAFLDDFFDDLFGSDDSSTNPDPYSIELVDLSEDKGFISKTARTFKLKIYYPSADSTKIEAIANNQLNNALVEALDISSLDAESGVETGLEELAFSLRFKAAASRFTDILELQFISDEMVFDKVQRLKFSFNAKQFLRLLNVQSELDGEDFEDKLFLKPVIIALSKPILEPSLTLSADGSALPSQDLVASFKSNSEDLNTQIDNGDIVFTYKIQGKDKIALAKSQKTGKVYPVEVSLGELFNPIVKSGDTYNIRIPISLQHSAKAFKPGTQFSISVPVEIETTESQLKTLLRGVARGSLISH